MADTGLFLVRGILIVNVPDELHDEMALSLQSAIALLRGAENLELPLQFENFRD